MPSPSLDWLNDLPDLRVTRVTRVTPQKSATNPVTQSDIRKVTRVTSAPCVTVVTQDADARVTLKPPENLAVTPVTQVTRKMGSGSHGSVDRRPVIALPGLAGEWSTLIGRCDADRCPPSLQPHRWREILSDADAFLQQWGEQAAAFGWTAMDLFSVPPGPERWGRGSLIMALGGRPVIALTEQTATIPNPSGAPHRYQRREKYGAVMLWDERAFSAS